MRLTRRQCLALAPAALAACAARRRSTDELVLGIGEDRGLNDPASLSAQDWTHVAQVYETLVAKRRDGVIEPCLAMGWRVRDDVSWEFPLRPGVTFHDGTPVDARAAARAIERAVTLRASGQPIEFASIDTPDSRTLRLVTTKPFRPLPDFLCYLNFAIAGPALQGTGPFRVTSYRREDWTQLTRNENYWGPRPPVSRLTFRFLPDAQTRLLALEAGELDGLRGAPTAELTRLRGNRSITATSGPGRHTHYIGFNRSWSPWRSEFDDPRFREAFNIAVDRKAILRLFDGVGLEASGAVPPWMPAFADLPLYPHDPRGANELLNACGWSWAGGARLKNGKRLQLRFFHHPTWLPQSQSIAELLQAQCAESGIELKLYPADWPAANTAEREGIADIRHRGLTYAVGGTWFAMWTAFSGKGTARSSIHFKDETVDSLLDAAASSQDPSPPLKALQERVYREHAVVPLIYEHELFAVQSQLEKFPMPHPMVYPLDLSQTHWRSEHAART